MSRDFVDIPEAFKRAFEKDNEWQKGGGSAGNGGNGGDGNGRGPARTRMPNRWVWIPLAVLLVLLSFNWLTGTLIDWLWFNELGYQRAWLLQWGLRLAIFVVAFVLAAVILFLNWRTAFKQASDSVIVYRIRVLRIPGMRFLVYGMALFIAIIFGVSAASQWDVLLLFLNRQPYGATDPIFNLDIGFYLFQLPVYQFLVGWILPLLVVTLLGVLALYLADSWANLNRGALRMAYPLAFRRHAAMLAAAIFIVWSLDRWMAIYQLLYSTRGVTFGASFTDLKAVLPALYIQIGLLVVLAALAVVNIFRSWLRPLFIAGGVFLVTALLVGGAYPAILQRYSVEPNELARERPYIAHNITLTRLAFGLDRVNALPFGDVTELTRSDLEENSDTLRNIRLWDYRPLQQTYAQLQELRPYYEFSSIDIDRYEIDGEFRQVMLAGRELNKANLTAQSWVNQKLEFTHGYGVVMNPVDEVTPEGRPVFFIKDLPPQSEVPIEVTRPELYYGEMMNDVVYVNSDLHEFDYPVGTQNAYSSYEGQGGVPLSSFWRRLAFVVHFGEVNLLLSEYITPETRVMMHRQITDRVQRITPFIVYDHDPYLVAARGRLVWMLDAYTISDRFPYSTPSEQGFNYIRNAVKITIDAYDGTVNYFISDPDDPIIQAYAKAFPGVFQPLDNMPSELRAHIRYPEGLFLVQSRQYLKYHMLDVQVFYNQEDLWEIPLEKYESEELPMEPYYVILSLPNTEGTEFLLIQPYTPAGRNNMIGWVAARNDPPNYGELVVYELPKQELVFGPAQVEARIDQDPEISAQVSLWNQLGSRTIRGNLLVIPMNDSFLYVEPLYLLAETSELPELARVIVASGDRIVMRETLDEALADLLEGEPSVVETPAGGVVTGGESAEPPASGDGELPSGEESLIEQLIQSANEHFEAAEAAQRRGDWTTYGQELEALQRDLERLLQETGDN